jgi:BirA family biotin operon repressor/biotin-[acetyl-CoA-carboxylase] ligase
VLDDQNKVLGLLYERRPGAVAAAELAAQSGLGPAGVRVALEGLERRGHVIERLPEGLRLAEPLRLDAYLIERELGTRRVGRNAIVFGEVDSTNDVAFDSARQGGADGLVVLAEHQKRGRGRHGRTWQSPPGSNVLLSTVLIDAPKRLAHEPVTIAAGAAVAEAVAAAAGVDARLKWPNDVLIDGAKVAGVLVEVKQVSARRCIVVGVGINVSASPPREMVDAPATNLAAASGGAVDRVAVVRQLLCRLDYWIGRIEAGSLDELAQAWRGRCGMIGERVRATCGGTAHEGTVLDVDPLEGLVITDDSGRRLHLPAASTTLKP